LSKEKELKGACDSVNICEGDGEGVVATRELHRVDFYQAGITCRLKELSMVQDPVLMDTYMRTVGPHPLNRRNWPLVRALLRSGEKQRQRQH